MWITPRILAAVAVVAFVLAIAAPLHSLLLFDLVLAPIQGHTSIGGVLMDHTDAVFGILALGFLLRRRLTFKEIRNQVPFFWLWVALGALLSAVYLNAPLNQPHLTAFHRAVYQVFRASWKPILYYPLAALLLNTVARSRQALFAVVLAGDICSVFAIPQGYQGFRAWGPFGTGNTLGAVLIVPVVVSFAKLVFPHTPRERWFYGISLLLVGRAALFARSRGAFAGMLAGLALVLLFLALKSTGRQRLLRLVPVGLAATLLVFTWKPDVLQRPNVRRIFTLTNPMEQRTMQWRIENRWSFYWEKSFEKPWLGFGTDIDESLREVSGAKTPHNSYLSLVVENGFPAAVCYLALASLSLMRGLRYFHGHPITQTSVQGLILAAGMVGLMGHFMADSIINVPQVSKTFWLLAGLAASLPQIAQRSEEKLQESEGISRRTCNPTSAATDGPRPFS